MRPNTPERIRTSGLCLRRAALYPAELRAQGAAVRGTTPRGIRTAMHPGWITALCVAPRANSAAIPLSSRLASPVPHRSRCSRGVVHGLPVMIRRGRFPVNPGCEAGCRGSKEVGPAALKPRAARRQEDGRRKPSSVSRRRGGQGSFIWGPDRSGPRAAYPGLGRDRRSLVPYLALLRMGFAMRPLLPAARCALTAPFHPCLYSPAGGTIGGLLSAALSVASRRPGVTRHPALRSSDFPPRGEPEDSRRRSLGPSSWTRYQVATGPAGGTSPRHRILPGRMRRRLVGTGSQLEGSSETTTTNICLLNPPKLLCPNRTYRFLTGESAMPGRLRDVGLRGHEQGVTES